MQPQSGVTLGFLGVQNQVGCSQLALLLEAVPESLNGEGDGAGARVVAHAANLCRQAGSNEGGSGGSTHVRLCFAQLTTGAHDCRSGGWVLAPALNAPRVSSKPHGCAS